MKESTKLSARPRTECGAAAVRRLRQSGLLPGVVYGNSEPKNVAFDAAAFATLQRQHSSENLMLELNIEGDSAHQVLIREVQHHPVTGLPLHVDFYELAMDRKVRVSVPLEFTGTPVGVSRDGGILEHLVREVEVECLPGDILEEFELDVSGLEVDERFTAADIPLDPAKYTLITAGDIAVAAVAPARLEDETTTEDGTEPEVIGEEKEEDSGTKESKGDA